MPSTLPEILQRRSSAEAGRRAYVFLDEHGQEQSALTYGELHARALAVADRLHQSCLPGDRAVLLFPPGLDFIVAYFGCLYAQVIAVPVSPPRPNRVQEATRSIITDCRPAAVLTTGTMMAAAQPLLEPVSGAAQWVPVDELDADARFVPEPASLDSTAFLQYTSGSTAAPKGVVVSHRNLVANQEMIQHAFGHDEHSTFVGWTPLHHDQGLIGNVLQPLHLGVTSVLMAPGAFIRRPLNWLSAISRYRAHTSGGPNFAFDACIAHAEKTGVADLDLSSWKVAFNGAEPLRHDTLRRFAETFAPFGFSPAALYPCYGSAEATLLSTGSRKGRGPRTVEADIEALGRRRLVAAPPGQGRTLVGSGLLPPTGDVRIVDPETRTPCVADEIGEIWISGDHVATGYWQRPELTEQTLRARCDGVGERVYLRTGDLGVVSDDELYVVGRLKDVIIIRGRNHYPHDLEHTAQSAHPALQPTACAAFAVDGPEGEKLVVVQELKREATDVDTAEVRASIKRAIVQEHELSPGDVVLAAPGQLRKTTSGKIMRGAAKKHYLESGFESWRPSAAPA